MRTIELLTVGMEMILNRLSTGEVKMKSDFDKAVDQIPKWIMDCPISANWLEYKGETYFGIINYERSVTAKRAMIDLSYCATRAMNGVVLLTVHYSKKHFKKSRLDSRGEVKPDNMKALTQAELEARALIAGDLLKEGEVTRAETFRVEVDALLGENTGDLKFEKNEDFEKGEM